jgi:Mlc titration factor MtfA (ptsG expression regulator)
LRVDAPHERVFARAASLVAIVGGLLLGGLLGGTTGAAAGGGLGGLLALVILKRADRRAARRRDALAIPFTDSARTFLLDRYDHYDRLPPDWRVRFEDDLRIFLAEKRITGVEVEVTEELRLLVAASAVTVSLGWPDYDWQQLTEVLLYPQDFDRDYRFGGNELSGQTHAWGTVILSVPSLRESFEDPDDGFHVGIHEFAHLLDVSQTRFEGIPAGLPAARSREWVLLAEKEMARLRKGKSVIDPYGADDPVEFLAVAVEAFFEPALEVRRKHRELYDLLAEYFGQDPAAWDDARGLVLD